ncbi:hypothetical protein N9A28_02110 [Sulfurimonas sp.]|nr:hypothetical protein [Sulfurimonas sp.]
MKTIFSLFLFSTLIFANNPKVFSSLGDSIYNNVDAIDNLKNLTQFSYKKDKIQKYVSEVSALKELGFMIEANKEKNRVTEYLKKIRSFSEINQSYIRDVRINFKGAMKTDDNDLFMNLLESGLVDINMHKKEILNYYKKHNDLNDTLGIVSKVVIEEKKRLESVKSASKNKNLSKIQRIRAKDKAKQDALKKSLEEEAIRKKIEIRNNQKQELSNN